MTLLRTFFLLLSLALTLPHYHHSFASASVTSAAADDARYTLPSVCGHIAAPTGETTPAFQELCETLAAPSVPKSLAEAFELVQGKLHEGYTWLRTGERYAVAADESLSLDQAKAVIAFCEKAGFFAPHPIPEGVQALLIMGSTLPRVRAQVQSLNQSLEKNPDLARLPVWFVAGERMLAETAGETQEALWNPPPPLHEGYVLPEVSDRPVIADERAMVRLVAEQSLAPAFAVGYALAEKRPGSARATTADCMKVWFESTPTAGVYAIVSSNPFIAYQEIVSLRQALINGRKDIAFIGCGPAISPESYIAKMGEVGVAKVLLDNIARILYEMYELEKMKSRA